MGLFNFFKKKKTQEIPPAVKKIFDENPIFQMMGEQIKSNPQATDKDEIAEGYGEFGLEPTNPVPVCGVIANNVYLNRLIHKSKGAITFNRIGSFESPNIVNSIDNYEIFDSRGDRICNIYISPYHHSTSNKVSKGFIKK